MKNRVVVIQFDERHRALTVIDGEFDSDAGTLETFSEAKIPAGQHPTDVAHEIANRKGLPILDRLYDGTMLVRRFTRKET